MGLIRFVTTYFPDIAVYIRARRRSRRGFQVPTRRRRRLGKSGACPSCAG